MKVLFTADWHILLGQRNVPKAWQTSRYESLYAQVDELAKQENVDYVINGGDIFDRLPTIEELELYFKYVSSVTVPTIIYDGNHEATKKGATFLTLLRAATSRINNLVEVITCEEDWKSSSVSDAPFDFIPYTELKTFKPESYTNNILFTHVRGEIPPHVKPEIDLDKLNRWDVVYAGDLHSNTNSQRNIVYPGSPLTTSFHRNKVDTGVVVFDTSTPKDYEFKKLLLPQLLRKTVSSVEDAVETDFDHTVYEIEGSALELASVDAAASDLIDKKLVSTISQSKLDLEGTDLASEVVIYLDEVMQLSDEEIKRVIHTAMEFKEFSNG